MTERWQGVPVGVPCWHIHHDELLEWSIEPLEQRAAFIREHKPAHEIPVRLQFLAPVRGALPEAVVEARRVYNEARRALNEAVADHHVKMERAYAEVGRLGEVVVGPFVEVKRACAEARRAYNEAVVDHRDEIKALHRSECPDCPWDGKTIFPKTN